MRFPVQVFFALCLATSAGFASAQAAYPTKPVTLVVGVPPGGILDAVARMIVPSMSQSLGRQVIVENKAGASGNIAATGQARRCEPPAFHAGQPPASPQSQGRLNRRA